MLLLLLPLSAHKIAKINQLIATCTYLRTYIHATYMHTYIRD